MYKILKLHEHPELKQTAAEWFHSKWGVPLEEYLKSMEECIAKSTAVPQWYVAFENDGIIGGLGVIENDFHERKDLTPNVCAVYVEERCRCRGIAGKLLKTVCKDMSKLGVNTLYLLTDHDSFYERYDWKFLCEVTGDGEEKLSRMYVHKTVKMNRVDLMICLFALTNSLLMSVNVMKNWGTIYLSVACWVIMLIIVVLCAAAFIKNIREHCLKKRHIVILIFMIAGCVGWSIIYETPYIKDIVGGTVSVTTEFYRPHNDTMIIYRENEDSLSLSCTENLSCPLFEKFSIDKSKTLEVSDNISVYAGKPKVTITYYPNSRLVKEIILNEE